MRKILILTANPKDTARLRLDREVREIQEGLLMAKNRAQFDIQQQWATRYKDVRRALFTHKPQFIHFCGHGEKDGLLLENDEGKMFMVGPKTLAGLFELFAKDIQCVVLNACYSESQADAIAQHISYVVGMRQAIGDQNAIDFAVGFYDALWAGRSVEDAYKFGCNAIQGEQLPEELIPVLKRKGAKRVSVPAAVGSSGQSAPLADQAWTDDDWSALIYSIREEKCLLLLGPDTALASGDETRCPLSETLARELAEKIKPQVDKWRLDPSNFPQMAQYYALAYRRYALKNKVISFYQQDFGQPNDLYRDLAALPFPFTMSTMPDTLWDQALRAEQKTPRPAWYNYHDQNPMLVEQGDRQHPLIFYLYGYIEQPNSLVLTESDLLDFLVAVARKTPPLPVNVLSELRDPEKSFLFLGFGFRQWYLRILLHILMEGTGRKHEENYSVAMEAATPKNLTELGSSALFYRSSSYKIHVYQHDLPGFVAELRERYEADAADQVAKPRPQSGPTIFLCHAPADQALADQLAQRLDASGYKVWRDAQRLRGRDKWPQVLERVIQQSANVLALHSQAFCAQREEYIQHEIQCALQYQQQLPFGTNFVIPVKMEDCSILEELTNLKVIDLTQPDGFEALLADLQRAQSRRKR